MAKLRGAPARDEDEDSFVTESTTQQPSYLVS